jgi:DNA-binding GntR family transcriptional regulator
MASGRFAGCVPPSELLGHNARWLIWRECPGVEKTMLIEPGVLAPLKRTEGRGVAVEVYETLRETILSGHLLPGAILSQVAVARALGVSRTPVREAMRMLQESGLVTGEPNLRSRVLDFDPNDIESLYMKRILLESLGVALTVKRMTPALVGQLRDVIGALEGEDAHENFSKWSRLHRELHRLIVSKAGDPYVNDLVELEVRSERYQSAYKGAHVVGWWQRGQMEHRALFEAILAGDAGRAAELAARHLARTALEVLAALAPEHDTSRIRSSLRFAIAAAAAHET